MSEKMPNLQERAKDLIKKSVAGGLKEELNKIDEEIAIFLDGNPELVEDKGIHGVREDMKKMGLHESEQVVEGGKKVKEEYDEIISEAAKQLNELRNKRSQVVEQIKALPEKDMKEYLEDEGEKFIKDYPELKDAYLEGRIKLVDITVGGKTREQIIKELDEREKIKDCNDPNQIAISDTTKKLIGSPAFKISSEQKTIKTVVIKVRDLGFSLCPNLQKFCSKAEEVGLSKPSPELALFLRLNYQKIMGHDQPACENIIIGMDPISGSSDGPYVFDVNRNRYGKRYLDYSWVHPDSPFAVDRAFLFVRK